MRVLVNYAPEEKKFLPMLSYHMKQAGLDGVATYSEHTIQQLQDKAKANFCKAILLCNEDTLKNLVAGKNPTLDQHRGSRLNYDIPVVVCNSLSHIKTVSHGEWLLQSDLAKFKHLARPPIQFDFTALTTADKFAPALAALSRAILIAYDIETDLLNDDPDDIEAGDTVITCCSWTGVYEDGSYQTFVLPLISFGLDHWTSDDDYAKSINLLRAVNSLPVPKAMQNGMYDALHSIRYHAPVVNWQVDTLGIAHSTFSELPKTLDFIASYQLYDYIYWKEEADLSKKVQDVYQYWGYNAKDSWYTARIAIEQIRTMPAYAKKNYAFQFKLVYPCLYTSFEGILIDNEERLKQREIAQGKLEEAKEKLCVMFADPGFNPGSWQQVEHYIYKVFGAKKPGIGKSKSGTDEKNLVEVGKQHPLLSKLTSEIITYRGEQKAIGTYFEFKQLNSRLLYSIDPFGTETSRMACRSSSMWCGTQVQNIPKYAKSMLIADEGYEMVEVDNSQSEARCTAYCSAEWALADALETPGRDFYRYLGTLFFSIPYEEVTDFLRNKVIKKVVHGTNYVMGAKTFTENIGTEILHEAAGKLGLKLVPIPNKNKPDERSIFGFAKELLELYHVPFPNIRKWYKKLHDEIQATGYLTGPLGNVRKFFGDIAQDHKMLRGAVAHQPQNLSVHILNIGLWKIYKQLVLTSEGKFRLKAQVHDSVLAQYPIAERHIWIPAMQKLMYNPQVINGRTLIIPTEAEHGVNWKNKTKYVPE